VGIIINVGVSMTALHMSCRMLCRSKVPGPQVMGGVRSFICAHCVVRRMRTIAVQIGHTFGSAGLGQRGSFGCVGWLGGIRCAHHCT